MPRFFVRVCDAGQLLADDGEAQEFESLEQVREEAIYAARELLCHAILNGKARNLNQQIEVFDEDRTPQYARGVRDHHPDKHRPIATRSRNDRRMLEALHGAGSEADELGGLKHASTLGELTASSVDLLRVSVRTAQALALLASLADELAVALDGSPRHSRPSRTPPITS